MSWGSVQIILHAHLPFVRHPENAWHLEENWFFEAISETYLPLLDVCSRLDFDGVPGQMTISISQPLAAMFDDELLRDRFSARLRSLVALCEKELEFAHERPELLELARWYHARFTTQLAAWEERWGRDLLAAFAHFRATGRLEIATCVGTHGSLPLMRFDASRRAQVLAAAEAFEARMGFAAAGMWMGECAYWWGVDRHLAEAGVNWTIVDAHGIEHADAAPTRGVFAPLVSDAGVAFFGRDPESSRQVWSATEGYPGDLNYREFYRDVGFDRDAEYIAPWIHPDGIRVDTGLKYYRITTRDSKHREPWNPVVASEVTQRHARHFVEARVAQLSAASQRLDIAPVLTAPYDAELYGHWWFEGPEFLEHVLREAARDGRVEMTSPTRTLQRHVALQVANPAPSSWGEGGYWSVWLNPQNAWMYRELHAAEGEMRGLAQQFAGASAFADRALRQAARELLMAQASDWAFIVKTGTAVGYANQRTVEHTQNLSAIASALRANEGIALKELLDRLEPRTPIFPNLDPRWWA